MCISVGVACLGLFPKDSWGWLKWIQPGKALYLDKEKVLKLIGQQRTNFADVTRQSLDSVISTVRNFKNASAVKEKNPTGVDNSADNLLNREQYYVVDKSDNKRNLTLEEYLEAKRNEPLYLATANGSQPSATQTSPAVSINNIHDKNEKSSAETEKCKNCFEHPRCRHFSP